jgi:hypothetical protein
MSIIQGLWWLLFWAFVSIVFFNWLGPNNADTSGLGMFVLSVGCTVVCSGPLAAITYGCSTWRWVAWSVAIAAAILFTLGIVNSQNVPSSETRRSRVGAIASDGWVSGSTARGAASHHGGVRQWLYEDWQRPLTEHEVTAWKSTHIWLPGYAALSLGMALAGGIQARLSERDKGRAPEPD